MTNIEYNEDKTRAVFNGRTYYLRQSQGYYYAPRRDHRGCDMLHRMVYIHYNGEIPQGYHIHHKDGNKANNDISNLECLPMSKHLSDHCRNWSEERIEKARKNLEEIVRPKACEWHGSAEGREWHRQHYEQMKDKFYEQVECVCTICGKPFTAHRKGGSKCCSNACRAKERRMSGLDNETRICETCGKEFVTSKFSKVRYCSKNCAQAVRKKTETRICPYCGKEFTAKPSEKKVCCSIKCGKRYFAKPMSDESKEKISMAYKDRTFKRPILQFDTNGNYIKEWEYIKQVTDTLGIAGSNITRCCRGKQKTAGGYVWKYKEE